MSGPTAGSDVVLALDGLVGLSEEALVGRLGEPGVRREVGSERWLVFERPGLKLRVRCARGDAGGPAAGPDGAEAPRAHGGPTVRSWSVTYDEPKPTLRQAAAPLGLWPACAPDCRAADLDAPLARRALGGEAGPERSLTAVPGPGGFRRVAVFDEPPEWT